MVESTLAQIRRRLEKADSIKEENRTELLNLLARLEQEMAELDSEHAESIAGFAQTSTHEAIRKEKSPPLDRLSLDGLRASVAGFEESHPRLVEIVNSICVSLSNLGI